MRKLLIDNGFVYKVSAVRRLFRRETDGIEFIFSKIYRNKGWGGDESVSGPGSTLARTQVIREKLPALIRKIGAESLLDAACGDFNWMQHVDLEGARYLGAEVVPEIVELNRGRYETESRKFVLLDITRDELPANDLILCRDCFIHLSNAHIHDALANFKRSECKFLIATTHVSVKKNRDIATGGWRSVNLMIPPFSLPQPIDVIVENTDTGKCLGLWRLDDLRNT